MYRKCEDTVKRIFDTRLVDVNARTVDDGDIALTSAAAYENVKIVQMLLESGANIEGRTYDGQTALLITAENGNEGVVRLLLEKGVDVEAKDDGENTALLLAATSGKEGVLTLLLEEGNANVDIRNNSDETPLS